MIDSIGPEERGLAVWTHLSGLAGYILPLGGVVVPIVIWIVKNDSPVISRLAKQALLLNVGVFLTIGVTAILWLTVILIPVVILFWILLGFAAFVLPIVGAVRASQGRLYRYPFVGALID